MSDLISRQDAIDALNDGAELLRRVLDKTYVVGDDRAKYEWGIGLIESYISDMKELPSAHPEQQWIPCSERLPHGSWSDLVNVSIHDDSGDTPFDYTSCGWVTTEGEYWIVANEINTHVVAWMPLPEPWKGESDE